MQPRPHQEDAAAEALPPAGPHHAEAPAPPHPAPAGWRPFDEQELRRRSNGDKLAAAVMLVLLVVARSRTGTHDTLIGEVHSGSVLVLCIVVMLGAEELVAAGWHRLREVLVIALKLAAATAPLFHVHALYTLQGEACGSGAAAGGAALLRITLADHTALLAFTGIAMPTSILATLLSQLLFLYSVAIETPEICATPYMQTARVPAHLLSYKKTCYAFVSTSQLLLGVLLPLQLVARREVSAALQYAREAGIPATDRRLRAYRWLCRLLLVTAGQ